MSEIDLLKALVKYNTVEDKENQKILAYIESYWVLLYKRKKSI